MQTETARLKNYLIQKSGDGVRDANFSAEHNATNPRIRVAGTLEVDASFETSMVELNAFVEAEAGARELERLLSGGSIHFMVKAENESYRAAACAQAPMGYALTVRLGKETLVRCL